MKSRSIERHCRTDIVGYATYRVRTVITKLNSRIFQYIPGWIELNFQDFSDSDVVHHTSVAINMLSSGRKLCE